MASKTREYCGAFDELDYCIPQHG
jgi:hypothetical protein